MKKNQGKATPQKQVNVKQEKITGNGEDDSIIFDLPEVKDIPGQENIKPPRIREMMDDTASSADEEGEGLLDDVNKEDDDSDIVNNADNVTALEREYLNRAEQAAHEDVDRENLLLDSTDGEDELNEKSNPENLGEDLDYPGNDEDDQDKPGEEDEENNVYSRGH